MNTRIKTVRQKFGLTQAQFAERISLSQNYIALIETGKRDPSDRTISDICREFGVSLDWLKNGGDEKDMFGASEQDEFTSAFGELAARKDPTINGFIDFLRSRTPEQLNFIAQQLQECAEAIKAANRQKKEG